MLEFTAVAYWAALVIVALFIGRILCLRAISSGKTGSVTINATARPYDQFDIKFKSEVIDTTNFTTSGYQTNVPGIFSADVSFSGPYDGAEAIAQGDSIAITFATGSAVSLVITTRLSEVGISTAARNKADQIAVSGTSNGTFSVSL